MVDENIDNDTNQRGRFIVVEGLDGAGTTSQASGLVNYLKSIGHKAHLTCEPSKTLVGTLIRGILSKKYTFDDPQYIATLFLTDRIEHTKGEVIPLLEKGVDVVSDRYYHSSAYQMASGMDLDYILAIHKGIIAPDLTLFLDIPAQTGMDRILKGRVVDPEIYETLGFLGKVQQQYYRINNALEARGEKIVSINGSMSLEEVTKSVQAEVNKLYK